MGVLINEVCCIDANCFNENENDNYQSSQHKAKKSSQMNGTYKNMQSYGNSNKLDNSDILEPLPLNEIIFEKENNLDSLSKLPISNRNVIRKQTGNPLDDYDVVKKLGKGTFGTVYKVINKKTGIIRAMKVIPKNNLKCGFTDEDIIQEIDILKKLDHPHIIRIFEFYTFKKNYYLINEFCTDGDLSEKLIELRTFPEFIVKILMIQVFNAVMYLNKNCVIHGDLKLENIMIDSYLNKDESITPKGRQCNFIQSLLEDEKEINEYLREKALKRANTYHDFGIKGLNLKSKRNGINMNDYNDEFKENDQNNFNMRKKGKTCNKLKLSGITKSNNNIKEEKNNNKCSIRPVKTINNIKGILKNKIVNNRIVNNKIVNSNNIIIKKKKSDFSYLNGEDDDEEEEKEEEDDEDKKKFIDILNDSYSDNENQSCGRLIENGKGKMNNIKAQNEDFINNQLDKNINNVNKYQKFIKENKHIKLPTDDLNMKKNNSDIRRTLTLNSMKMKNFELKLIDFGCAKIFSKYKRNFEDTIGTLIYCSPEVLKNNYSNQCDIWSCGVIMYVLLGGHFPFYGKTEDEIKNKILSGKFNFNKKYFSNVSEKAKDLIRKCLVYDKNKRITAEAALKHEFFADDINPNNIFEDEIDSKYVLQSLKNFSQQSKIYQTVLTFLSHNFAEKVELNKLKKIFYKIDLNLDGKLSKEELFIAYKEAGMEMENDQLNKVIKSIDFDGNGFIEYEEFIRVTLPKEQLFTEDHLKYAFDLFDLDKSGTISLNEFKEILGIKQVTDKNVNRELLKEIPINEDEEMTFEQFKNIFKDNNTLNV